LPSVLRERKKNRCTLIGFRLGPDAAAVAAYDALHDRKPDAGPRKFIAAVQALKHPK
jgi:hypothetical protein